jgi:hypothetical protein
MAGASLKEGDRSIPEVDHFAKHDHDHKKLMSEIIQLRDEIQRLWLLCESLGLDPEPFTDDSFLSVDEWIRGNVMEPRDEKKDSLLHSPHSGNYDWLVDLVYPKTGLGDVVEDNYSGALQSGTIDPKLCFYNPSSARVDEAPTGVLQRIDNNTARTPEEDYMDFTESYDPKGAVQNSIGSGANVDETGVASTIPGCHSIPSDSTPPNNSEDTEVSTNDQTNLSIMSTG